jgi:sugar (pentulose or hexulose) kinase
VLVKSEQRRPYLAFDFGAESGRAVLAHLQSGILTTEEVHRFRNEPVEYGGSLHWDVPRLWFEVRKALARVEHLELNAIGVDAWGVIMRCSENAESCFRTRITTATVAPMA